MARQGLSRKQASIRDEWTRFVEEREGGAVATLEIAPDDPGKCQACGGEIPADRLAKRRRSCSTECGRATQSAKYGGQKVQLNGRWFDSKREAQHAEKLTILQNGGKIKDLAFQHRIVLVPGDGRLQAVVYWADFFYRDLDGTPHVVDAKGWKTPMYRLKKRLCALLLGITIEEV